MRLLHTKEFRFQEFFKDDSPFSNIPPYAILSHRWGSEEVSYHEFLHLTGNSMFEPTSVTRELMNSSRYVKAGFMKVVDACDKAAKEPLEWIWIDTCCIDKSSSAELTDVENGLDDREHGLQQFRKSAWFTRGWTLQELLAPQRLAFIDRKWRFFGMRDQLEETISEVTRIPIECLGSLSARKEKSVATKMKWAANRQTSRVEDRAYCLLGLFDVNMPLLYGEGFKAFRRLQEEIIRQSDDETIFVHKHSSHFSPLAYSPADFETTIWGSEIQRGSHHRFEAADLGSTSYTVTNKGIQMRAAFVGGRFWEEGGRVIALDCCSAEHGYQPVLLSVQQVNGGGEGLLPSISRRVSERDSPPSATLRPDKYIIDLRNHESRSNRGMEAPRGYLDSWLSTGSAAHHGEPFVYQTIYLASDYADRYRRIRTPQVR